MRLGTRASLLATRQTELISKRLSAANPGLILERVIITTTGDQILDRPLHDIGGKGLFVKEIEVALLEGRIDIAVHSCKDLPVTEPLVDESGLVIAAIPARHDPRDVLVCQGTDSLAGLKPGAVVGTSSLRRRCQILTLRPDVKVEPLRGNVDTRLRKLREGAFDAIVLALAGVERAGLFDAGIMHPIPVQEILPAPAQGALALQCRRGDAQAIRVLETLEDAVTRRCVEAERALVARLNGDCHSPIAALATVEHGKFFMRAAVGRRDGFPPVVSAQGDGLIEVVQGLMAQNAAQLLLGQGATNRP